MEQPLIFIASILIWALAGMLAYWAFINKGKINPMLLNLVFGIMALTLLLFVFYLNPRILDLAQENFIVFVGTLAGSAIFGALFLPFLLITLITAIAGLQRGG